MRGKKRIHASLLCVCMAFSAQSAPVLAADAANCVHMHTEECGEVCEHICSEESGCLTQEPVGEQEDFTENEGALPGEGAMMEEEQSQSPEQSNEGTAAAPAAANAPDAATNETEGMAAPAGEEPQEENVQEEESQEELQEMESVPQELALENAEAETPVNAPVLLANTSGEVADETALTAALADDTIATVKLTQNIDISSTLEVSRTVELDLNGFVLKYENSSNKGSVIKVASGGNLTITDSNEGNQSHRFTPNADGLWGLDEANGTKTVSGGSITGGNADNGGGGVFVGANGTLILESGNIVGCQANFGGGVYLSGEQNKIDQTTFTMSGGSITGCLATSSTTSIGGAGVCILNSSFTMKGGSIIECITSATGCQANGGGVHLAGSSFTMSDGEIKGCKCSSNTWSRGGGVYIDRDSTFTMNGGKITECTTNGSYNGAVWGGGVYIHGGTFTMNNGIIEASCKADDHGGVSNDGGTLNANGGKIACDVANGWLKGINPGRITGSGGTEFSGKVTNSQYGSDDSVRSTIESGTFTGEVENNGGIISGGEFLDKVTNNDGGEILGGDFSGAKGLSGEIVITFDPSNTKMQWTKLVTWGAKLTAPDPAPTPPQAGLELEGWYYNNNNVSTKWNFDTDKAKYTMTLTAKWAEFFTVNVQGDGNGTASASVSSAAENTTVTLTATPNSGYQFKQWQVVQPTTGLTFSGNSFTMPAENVEIKAIFEKKPTSSGGGSGGGSGRTYHKMTFETNGGSTIRVVNAARGDVIDLTKYNPTREGYEFIGWFADADLTQKITEIKLTGNVTVYAGWREIEPVEPETPIEPEKPEISNPFADVREENWFYDDVLFAYEQGILRGISENTFAPQTESTRAQIAAIFYRMEGSPAVEGGGSFADVTQGAWFYDAVTWAEKNGILSGYGNGSFGANDPVTREQLAAIFYRYAQFKGLDTENAGALDAFADKNDASAWAQTALAWAVESGILSGKGDSRLDPKGTATRAELAAMLHRFAEKQ